jgi:hypothetical protein
LFGTCLHVSCFRFQIINHESSIINPRAASDRDVPLSRGRVARIVPEFRARTTPENRATPWAQRNKEFLARGVFYLFNCCTNGTRNARNGGGRLEAGGSRRASLGSGPQVHDSALGSPSQTRFVAFGVPAPLAKELHSTAESLPPRRRGTLRAAGETEQRTGFAQRRREQRSGGRGAQDRLLRTQRWFPHTSTPRPRTYPPPVQHPNPDAQRRRGQRRVHLRRSPEAVHGPDSFGRRPIGGFLRKESDSGLRLHDSGLICLCPVSSPSGHV